MKKPLKTFLLVRAALDENEVPYLVADPCQPNRRVGIKRREWPRDPKNPEHPGQPPDQLDHFADHFEPFAHVVDASDIRHLAHYREEEKAKTLEILGQCQARTPEEAMTKLAPEPPPAARATPAAPAPAPASAAPAKPSPVAAPAAE